MNPATALDLRESRWVSKFTVLIKQHLNDLPVLISLGKGDNSSLGLHLNVWAGL